jgi:outer membrane biosynthesis protein TonB
MKSRRRSTSEDNNNNNNKKMKKNEKENKNPVKRSRNDTAEEEEEEEEETKEGKKTKKRLENVHSTALREFENGERRRRKSEEKPKRRKRLCEESKYLEREKRGREGDSFGRRQGRGRRKKKEAAAAGLQRAPPVCLLSFAGKEVPTKYGRCAIESGAWKRAQRQGRALSSRESPLSVREYLERILCKQFSKFRKSWKPAAAVALGWGGERI